VSALALMGQALRFIGLRFFGRYPMARENLKCIMRARVAFATGLLAVIAAGTSFATVAIAQDTVTPSLAPTILPATVGHRQPRLSDLPPSVQCEEQVSGQCRRRQSRCLGAQREKVPAGGATGHGSCTGSA